MNPAPTHPGPSPASGALQGRVHPPRTLAECRDPAGTCGPALDPRRPQGDVHGPAPDPRWPQWPCRDTHGPSCPNSSRRTRTLRLCTVPGRMHTHLHTQIDPSLFEATGVPSPRHHSAGGWHCRSQDRVYRVHHPGGYAPLSPSVVRNDPRCSCLSCLKKSDSQVWSGSVTAVCPLTTVKGAHYPNPRDPHPWFWLPLLPRTLGRPPLPPRPLSTLAV